MSVSRLKLVKDAMGAARAHFLGCWRHVVTTRAHVPGREAGTPSPKVESARQASARAPRWHRSTVLCCSLRLEVSSFDLGEARRFKGNLCKTGFGWACRSRVPTSIDIDIDSASTFSVSLWRRVTGTS